MPAKVFRKIFVGLLWSSVKLWNKPDGIQVPHYGIRVTPHNKCALAIIVKKLFFSHYVNIYCCFNQFYQVFWLKKKSGIVVGSGIGSDKTFQRLSNFILTLDSLFVMSFKKNGKQIHDCQRPSFVVGGNRKGWHLFPKIQVRWTCNQCGWDEFPGTDAIAHIEIGRIVD